MGSYLVRMRVGDWWRELAATMRSLGQGFSGPANGQPATVQGHRRSPCPGPRGASGRVRRAARRGPPHLPPPRRAWRLTDRKSLFARTLVLSAARVNAGVDFAAASVNFKQFDLCALLQK